MRRRIPAEKKRNANYDHYADDFDDGEKYLYAAAKPHAEIVHAGHGHQPKNGQRLRPGENKIIRLDPVCQSGNGDVPGENRSGHGGNKETEKAHHPCGD